MERTLGPYDLQEELGRGGCGAVFRARERETGRQVAVKLLLAGGLDAGERLRLAEEAQALARVSDPGLVAVHRLHLEGPRPYLVMDLVPGESLARRLERRGPLEPRRAVEVTLAIGGTLQRLHARGVVHRDLKPANVVVRPDGQPVLLDLGLALLLDRAARLTRTGELVGTPAFMSPEQVRGDRELGPATDVWGLGALLLTLLTGAPPFPGPTPIAMLEQILGAAPQLPGARRSGLDPRLDALCARCLEKSPLARPGLGQVLEALEEVLRGGPGRAGRGVPVALGVGAIGVAAGLALLLLREGSPAAATSTPAPAPSVLSASPAPDSPAAEPTARGLALARAMDFAGALRELEQALELDPAHVPALVARAKLRLLEGRRAEAEVDLQRALERDPNAAEAWAYLGLVRHDPVSERAVPPELERAVAVGPRNLEARRQRGWIRLQLGLPGAEDDLRVALEVDPARTEARAALALALLLEGRLEAAAEEVHAALERDPRAPEALVAAALVRAAEGDFTAARAALDPALLADPERAAGHLQVAERSPTLQPVVGVFLAEVELRAGHVDRAEQRLHDVEGHFTPPPRGGPLDTQGAGAWATLQRALARVALALGRGLEAEAALRAAIQSAPAADLFLDRARALALQGRLGEAKNDLSLVEMHSPDLRLRVTSLGMGVDLELRTGNPAGAREKLAALEALAPDYDLLPVLRERVNRAR